MKDLNKVESFHKTLEAHRPALDVRESFGIELAILAIAGTSEKKRIAHRCGVETFAHQDMLLLLEGLGGIEPGADADEERMRIGRQPARQMLGQRLETEIFTDHDRRHSGTAIG